MASVMAQRLAHDEWERKLEEQAEDLVKVNEELRKEITERNLAEEALCESSERLAEAHQLAKMTFWEWSKKTGKTTYRRDAYAGIRGVPFEDASYSYEEIYAFTHPDDRDRVKACYETADADGASFEIDHRIYHVDGSLIYVREIGHAVYNDAGEFTGHTGTQQDVTDLHERDKALREAHDELEQRVEERTRELNVVNAQLLEEIDERKQTEEKLRESQTRFKQAAQLANLGHWSYDEVADRIEYVSEEVARLHGITVAEYLSTITSTEKDINRAHPDDREQLGSVLRAAQRDYTPYDVTYRVLRPDGEIRHVRELGEPILDEFGRLIRSIGTIQDITEQKQIEEALYESEARYHEVFDDAPTALWVEDWSLIKQMIDRLSAEGVVDWRAYFAEHRDRAAEAYDLGKELQFSNAILELYGASNFQELIEWSWAKDVLPEEIDAFVEVLIGFIEGLWSGSTESLDDKMDGTEIMIRRRYVIPPANRHDWSRVIYSVEDITERKQLEDRLNEAARMANLGHWIWDEVNDRIIDCSEGFAQIYGLTKKEILASETGELDPFYAHPDDVEWLNNLYQEYRDNPRVYDIEYRVQLRDGSLRHIHAVGKPILNEEGQVVRTFGITQDITEHKQLEEQLRHSQRLEVVGQLTGGVAHDFNNLLAVMIGNADLLMYSVGEDEEAKHSIEAIKAAVERGASLTSRLLAFSRKQMLSPVTTDVTALVGGLLDMLHRTLGETIDLQVDATPVLWVATIDPHQFENTLVNLAINARDAMPRGGTLTIATANVTLDETYAEQHQEVTPGDYVEVSVSDSGTGIPPEVLEKVFEPFFTTKEVGKGSGLGLSMVYGFAKQSNGHITIHSEVGHGTTVKLYLPRSEEDVVKEGPEADTRVIARGSERILVVEDDAQVRDVPVKLLRKQGYDVVEAANGKEAIQHLEDGQHFDLLFTDVVLPGGMSGIEIAEKSKSLQPGIKVLFTSGYAENIIAEGINPDLGAALLSKPYPSTSLLEKVREVLDSVGE